MRGERGAALLELLVASLAFTGVIVGLVSLYVAMTRASDVSLSQLALQRRGTLALDEIARRVRDAGTPANTAPITSATCNGVAGALQVVSTSTTYYFYPDANGQLCEATGPACWNLIADADPRPRVSNPAGQTTIALTSFSALPSADNRAADIAFTISDGLNSVAFNITLTCGGRNC